MAGEHPRAGEGRPVVHLRRDQRPQAGGGYPPHLPEADHDLRIHHGHPTRLGTAECAAGGEGAPSSARPNVSPGASRPGAGADGVWRAIRQARPDDSTAVLNRRAPALLIGLLLVACGQPTAQPAPTASPRHTPTASPSPTPPPTPTPLPPPPHLPPAGGTSPVGGVSGARAAQGLGPI